MYTAHVVILYPNQVTLKDEGVLLENLLVKSRFPDHNNRLNKRPETLT